MIAYHLRHHPQALSQMCLCGRMFLYEAETILYTSILIDKVSQVPKLRDALDPGSGGRGVQRRAAVKYLLMKPDPDYSKRADRVSFAWALDVESILYSLHNLVELGLYKYSLAQEALQESPYPSQLQSLGTDQQSLKRHLLRHLPSQPCIRSLTVERCSWALPFRQKLLRSTHLVKLNHFGGGMDLADSFMHGRSVSSLSLPLSTWATKSSSDLEPFITKYSFQITSLTIGRPELWHSLLLLLGVLLPQLCHLTLIEMRKRNFASCVRKKKTGRGCFYYIIFFPWWKERPDSWANALSGFQHLKTFEFRLTFNDISRASMGNSRRSLPCSPKRVMAIVPLWRKLGSPFPVRMRKGAVYDQRERSIVGL
ncbi:hypothetical protein FRB95_010501 [Tulasnella sp. JGI-2019a]|nr:hypothetical protein FRB95_010501 [Tulasnella sp. JGI-2019a]